MHATSLELMRELRKSIRKGTSVLDVGGADVNGSYRELFADCSYASLDLKHPADFVVTGYEWPIEDASFGAVVTGQTFEHDPFFWITMQNIARVLRPGGIAIVIVPSSGGIHRHPVDCYRFLPDSMKALADWSGLVLLKHVWRQDGSWKDLGGVFQKPKAGLDG